MIEESDYRQADFDKFLKIFFDATSHVGEDYFQVLVADGENPLYRERVYCYELYHCIRELMNWDASYQLDGELDKAGHPLIHKDVGSVKPDFLVHQHGEMNNNIVAIEVKPINVSKDKIKKDISTLCKFLEFAHYYRAIYLVYGREDEIDKFLRVVEEKVANIPGNSFYLVWHKRVGDPAKIIWVYP